MLGSSVVVTVGVVAFFLFVSFGRSWWRLRHVPGPRWASITNLQRVWWVKTGRAHLYHQRMHDFYGDVVRIGPNMVSISNPDDISVAYPMRPGFIKGDFYATLRPYTKNTGAMLAVFNTQDEQMHRRIKNPITPLFSLSNVMKYEDFVDQVLESLAVQLDAQFSRPNRVCDIGEWLMYFAFDVMGLMTFSQTYGFIDQGRDVGGIHGTVFAYMKRASAWTQIPWLDKAINKNGFLQHFRRAPGMAILGIVNNIIHDRVAADHCGEGKRKDMLSHYLDVRRRNSDVPDWAPTAWVLSNVVAGSDSVGTVMQTLLYNLLTHPRTAEALRRELDASALSLPYPKWTEVRDLPYLDACVNEAARLHPPFALPLERVVPAGGITVSGVYLPAGTNVGGNPYVVNRHRPTFGEDVDAWRPERWLGRGPEEQKKLAQGLFTFGAGRRVCIGKHITMLEIKKLVPFLVMNYEMEVVDAEGHSVENSWFFKHKGIQARLRRRL